MQLYSSWSLNTFTHASLNNNNKKKKHNIFRSEALALLILRQNDDRLIFENNPLLPRENGRPFSADCGTWPIFLPKITNEMWGGLRSLERGICKMCDRAARVAEIKTVFKLPMTVHFFYLHLGKWKLSNECRFCLLTFFRQGKKR